MTHFSKRIPQLSFILAAALPASVLLGRSTGVLNGEIAVPPNLQSALPGCGATGNLLFPCHASPPNANGRVKVDIKSLTSFQAGSTVPVTVSVSGGVAVTNPLIQGGFSLKSDKPGVIAGVGQRGSLAGNEVTHATPASRSWTFTFKPSTTGLVKMHAAAQTANGNLAPTGDSFGFYGQDSSKPGTPYRLFANDSQVFSFGSSCAGTQGFAPVLGIAKSLQVGMVSNIETHNIPGPTTVILVMGISNSSWGNINLPVPLTTSGCALRVSFDATFIVPALG
ncbi:MAG: choice-of-anchor V domain-containing protein, partial [Planctomycetota bacterium]